MVESRIAWPSDATDHLVTQQCLLNAVILRVLLRFFAWETVYLLEADSPLGAEKFERTEYFWLCDACSATMTLRLAEGQRVVVAPLPGELRNAHDGVSLASRGRKKRLLLRSISLLSEHLEDHMSARWTARHDAA